MVLQMCCEVVFLLKTPVIQVVIVFFCCGVGCDCRYKFINL